MADHVGMTIEEALRDIRSKIVLVGYLASSASVNDERPDKDVLAEMATVCDEIESLARAVARAVPAAVLNAELNGRC